MTAICDICRFWVVDGNRQDRGQCHRRAPLPVMGMRYDNILAAIKGVPVENVETDHDTDMMERTAEWPVTEADEWCGEWEAKPH